MIDCQTGQLSTATYIASPNCDARPENQPISLIVIHAISLPPEQFGGNYITQLFQNQLDPHQHPYFAEIHQLKVSAHLLIQRTGNIIQYVPFHQRAWHAGQSSYQGKPACNDYAIGIELEGSDNQPFEEKQYQALTSSVKQLIKAYPDLDQHHIVGHSDIAPGRKTDPGPHFDWVYFRQLLAETEC